MSFPNIVELARMLAQQGDVGFENFVATLLVAEHPDAIQTNAGGGGDGGVDVYIDSPEGRSVWQIKNFHAPLNKSQRSQVKGSITSLRASAQRDDISLLRYVLVTAWRPNASAMRTFTAQAKVLGCPTSWQSDAFIAGLISRHPAIYDRALHGEGHLERFVAERALIAGTAPKDPALPGFVESVQDGMRALKELEALQTGPYRLMQTQLKLRKEESLADLIASFDGFMHRVTSLGDGRYEVQSAVAGPDADQAEPVTITLSVPVEELGSNPAAQDFIYWGKLSGDFGLLAQVNNGPWPDANPVDARIESARWGAAPEGLPPIVLDHAGKQLLRFAVKELTQGVLGGGKRILASSLGGAFELELRMGSDEMPDGGSLVVELSGGQDPAAMLAELQSLDGLDSADRVSMRVSGREFAAVSGIAPPERIEDVLIVARALNAWRDLADRNLVMPAMSDISEGMVRWIERAHKATQRQGVTETWTELHLRIGDPQKAGETLASLGDDLLFTHAYPLAFRIDGTPVHIARVLTQTYRGMVLPGPEQLARLEAGSTLKIQAGDGATVTWGVLVDDDGEPVEKLP